MIVDDDQRLAMEFIATVNRVGYRPTAREVNEWRLRPDPKPARRGKLLEPEIPGTPDRRVRIGGTSPLDGLIGSSAFKYGLLGESLSKQLLPAFTSSQIALLGTGLGNVAAAIAANHNSLFGLVGGQYKTIPGIPSTPAVYGPDRPPEKFLAHLTRLGWVESTERDDVKRYIVTELGHALLKADDEEPEHRDSNVIVLSKGDELAYAQVMGTIGESGHAMVVDAYLNVDALSDLLTHTQATRFLVNQKSNAKIVTALKVLVGASPPNGDGVVRELRQASYHDRYIVGDDFVYSLTSSLNGLGKNSALISELAETPALAVRDEVEHEWASATPLATGRETDDANIADTPPPRELTRRADGSFGHDGCTMRHTSRRTARECRKGA